MQQARAELEETQIERDNVLRQMDQLQGQCENLQNDNIKITQNNMIEQAEIYRQEIHDLKIENENMMQILIKRCKKDVLSLAHEVSPSVEVVKKSPIKEEMQSKILEQVEKPKHLFGNTPAHSNALGKTREKILTLNQVTIFA